MNTPENDSPIRQDVQPVPTNESEPTLKPSTQPKVRKPPRLWPGVIAAVLLVLFRFVLPAVAPNVLIFGIPGFALGLLGAFICALLITLWWLFFSRLPWSERLGGLVLVVITLIITNRLVHESISGGAMGNLLYVLAIPVFCLAAVVWAAVFSQRLSRWPRRAALVGVVFFAAGIFMLLRTGGITASFDNDFHWRWSRTPEDRLLAQGDEPAPTAPAVKTIDWTGFRGPQRDGVVHGTAINPDWTASPPVEMWRRPIGPGWSSFSVQNGRFYTQEQRGAQEIVGCYDVATGKPVWRHGDAARFYESNGGAGPRGTPTLHNGRVYALGATGILNVLDAANGSKIWSRNAVNDTGAKIPAWGISASPLIVNDMVIVAASGTLAAYDLANGTPRWTGPAGRASYSSPHLVTIGGVQQVVLLNADGAVAFSPADGSRLWEHAWEGIPIVQPNITADGDMLIAVSESSGTRRLGVAQGANGWTIQERWTSEELNPYFNDFVIHKGYAYGFNGNSLVCIDLANGTRKWRGGGYGNGQLVLLADQDLLVVLSEQGEVALIKAVSDQFTELGRRPAIKGKTWNHPVLAGDVLLVRNSEEMAAFKLAVAGT